jgi:hypothetical protein
LILDNHSLIQKNKCGHFVGIAENVGLVPDMSAVWESESKIVMSIGGKIPVFIPSNIIGLTNISDREVDGSVDRAKVVEEVADNFDIDENGEPGNDGWREYRVSLGDGYHEDTLTHNQILAHLEKQHPDGIKRELHDEKFWIFKEILDHRSFTWEPLNIIGKDE